MKKKMLLVAATATFLFCSCKKEHLTPVNPVSGSTKIKERKLNADDYVYTYNAEGNVTSTVLNGKTEYEYQYAAGMITAKHFAPDGSLIETIQYTLNADGLVENYQSDKYATTLVKYSYNPDKTLAVKTNYLNNTLDNTTWYFYNNGDLVKDSTVKLTAPNTWSGRTYTYYPQLSTTEFANLGIAFWGKGNTHALKLVNYITNGSIVSFQDYQQPVLDDQNRIVQTHYVSSNGGNPVVNTYSYY